MSTALNKPAVLRDSWRPREMRDRRAWVQRWTRRMVFTVALIALAIWFFFLLFSPFWHPNAKLVGISSGANPPLSVPPVAFASEDFQSLMDAGVATLLPLDEDEQASIGLQIIESADDLSRIAQAIGDRSLGSSDVLILYVAAHGVSDNGEAYLLCRDFDATSPAAGRYPLTTLLQQLAQSTAGVKLLLLDAGRFNYDPRLGLVVNEFANILPKEVSQTRDPRLWVLTANSPLERSWVSPRQRQSVFGLAISRGLQGEADLNADQMIDLHELHRFTTAFVSQFVQSESRGRFTQMPRLIAGSARTLQKPIDAPILVPVPPRLDLAELQETLEDVRKGKSAPAEPKSDESDSNDGKITSVVYRGDGQLVAQNGVPATGQPTASNGASLSTAESNPLDENAAPNETKTASADDRLVNPPDASLLEKRDASTQSLLNLAWQFRDYLERRDATRVRPLDTVPHLWRAEVDYLLSLEQLLVAGDLTDQRTLNESVRAEVTGLQQLATTGTTTVGLITPRISTAMPTPLVPSAAMRSFGLAERLAEFGGPTLDLKSRDAILAFDAAIQAEDREPFDRWITKLPASLAKQYYEFWLARRLADLDGVPWSTLQLALECATINEAVAADPFAANSKIEYRISIAESERLDGLRRLLDQIGPDWNEVARQRLTDAARQLRGIQDDLTELHEALSLRNELLFKARDYLQWRNILSDGPTVQALDSDLELLLRSLGQLSELLASSEPIDLDRVISLRWQLVDLRSRVDSTWQQFIGKANGSNVDPQRRWMADLLLRTSLPSAAIREQLLASSAPDNEPTKFSANVPRELGFPPLLSDDDWAIRVRQMRLEQQFASLAGHSADGTEQYDSPSGDYWADFRKQGLALQRFYRDLPGQIDNDLPSSATAVDPTSREAAQRQLRRLDVAWRLIDGRDAATWAALRVASELRRINMVDALARQHSRAVEASQDATSSELTFYREAAAELSAALATLVPPTSIPATPSPTMRWDGPTSVSLATSPKQQFQVTFLSVTNVAAPVWLHVDFDPSLIDVRIQPDLRVEHRDQLVEKLAAHAAEVERASLSPDASAESFAAIADELSRARMATRYPYRPDLAKLPSTTQLEPGDSQTLTVTISRTGNLSRRTKLIFKGLCLGRIVRHEIDIPMPGQQDVQLAVDGPQGGWTETGEGLVLHSWPNRETSFSLGLRNHGGSPKTVKVELLVLDERRPITVPNNWLLPDAGDELLGQLGPVEFLKTIDTLAVPAGGRSVPLSFEASPPTESVNGGNVATPEGSAKLEAPPPRSIRHGVVLMLTNSETSERLFRRIDFRPRRPRSYVRPVVSYDPNSERLTIEVTALSPSSVPSSGIRVQAEFADPRPRVESQLNAIIQPPSNSAKISAIVPSSAGQEVTVYLHVDGFPRAFIYDVPCWRMSRNLAESTDHSRVRIISPQNSAAYKAPAENVPARVQVDAPPGAFENGRDVLEVGWDLDRDREFVGESPLRIYSDRQADVSLIGFAPRGGVRLSTKVDDFALNIPGAGLRDSRVNLLARVVVGDTAAWSEQVEVVFDASGPRVNSIAVTSEGPIATGANLDVEVTAEDFDLSGVGSVEVGFDLKGTGRFAEDVPPIPATRNAEGVWIAQVPTTEVPMGPTTLLARAKDRVGNPGEFSKYALEIVSAEQLAAMKEQAFNRVSGTIVFGKSPLPGADVTLENEKGESLPPAKTDASGAFRFPAVPVGKYKLRALGVFRNRPRLAESEVVVEAPPAQATRLDLRAE